MRAEGSTLSAEEGERRDLVVRLVRDLFVGPREAIKTWARITRQTAQVRLAYPGQHLASVVTGIPGRGSAARGDDLQDGTEVKSCSRVDQLGRCKECQSRVSPYDEVCPECGSDRVDRKTDSHWIFPIRTEEELKRLLSLPRVLLVLFDGDDASGIRLRIWRVDPAEPYVRAFFEDYYYNNYLVKAKSGGSPAPCNLHPLKYDFYLMSPCLVFDLRITGEDIAIEHLDLDNQVPEPIPTSILKSAEIPALAQELMPGHGLSAAALASVFRERIPRITDRGRELLRMREKRIKTSRGVYLRESQRKRGSSPSK